MLEKQESSLRFVGSVGILILDVMSSSFKQTRIAVFVLLLLLLCGPHPISADICGDCERNGTTGLCQHPNTNCTITINGVAKAGKCKSHAISLGGFCICTPNDGTKVPLEESKGKGQKKSIGAVPPAPAVLTFELVSIPGGEGSIATVPDEFGGGLVGTDSFCGYVVLESIPTGNPQIEQIHIIEGVTVAPSITLPNGMETGSNVFEFIGPGALEGWLDRGDGTVGQFFFTAVGHLSNDLFPPGRPIQTEGEYFGVIDLTTGEIDFDTRTWDALPEPEPCEGNVLDGDINQDCFVDLLDFVQLSLDWLACTEPGNPDCITTAP